MVEDTFSDGGGGVLVIAVVMISLLVCQHKSCSAMYSLTNNVLLLLRVRSLHQIIYIWSLSSPAGTLSQKDSGYHHTMQQAWLLSHFTTSHAV